MTTHPLLIQLGTEIMLVTNSGETFETIEALFARSLKDFSAQDKSTLKALLIELLDLKYTDDFLNKIWENMLTNLLLGYEGGARIVFEMIKSKL